MDVQSLSAIKKLRELFMQVMKDVVGYIRATQLLVENRSTVTDGKVDAISNTINNVVNKNQIKILNAPMSVSGSGYIYAFTNESEAKLTVDGKKITYITSQGFNKTGHFARDMLLNVKEGTSSTSNGYLWTIVGVIEHRLFHFLSANTWGTTVTGCTVSLTPIRFEKSMSLSNGIIYYSLDE